MKRPPASIRLAKLADFDALLRLVEAYYKFDSIAFNESVTGGALRRLLRDKSLGRVWVVDTGPRLGGYAILTYNYDLEFGGVEGLLTDMFIVSRYRRRGFGAEMIAAVRDFLRNAGVGALELQVTRANRRARLFYQRLGFKALDRVVMSLDID
jgi:GNAT superfamily N-acetyltransferase